MAEVIYKPEKDPSRTISLAYHAPEDPNTTLQVQAIAKRMLDDNRYYDLGLYMNHPMPRVAAMDKEDLIANFGTTAQKAQLNLIATENNNPVGWAHLILGQFEDNPNNTDVFFISRLLLPNARRVGLGRQMTQIILGTAFTELGARTVISEVSRQNEGSLRSNLKLALGQTYPAIVSQQKETVLFYFKNPKQN